MKYLIYTFFVFCLFGCFGKTSTIETGLEGKPIPSIDMLLIDSLTHINIGESKWKSQIVLFYFSPICPYCKVMTESFVKDISSLRHIQLIMLSTFPLREIENYVDQFKLAKHDNIWVGQDTNDYFTKYFKGAAVPYIVIYGKDRRLKQVLLGAVNINVLKDLTIE